MALSVTAWMVASCGSCGDLEGAKNRTASFLEDVRAGRTQQAYDQMSSDYRIERNVERFRSSLAEIPQLSESTGQDLSWAEVSSNITNDNLPRACVTGHLVMPDGNESLTVSLHEEGSGWRITGLAVRAAQLDLDFMAPVATCGGSRTGR